MQEMCGDNFSFYTISLFIAKNDRDVTKIRLPNLQLRKKNLTIEASIFDNLILKKFEAKKIENERK